MASLTAQDRVFATTELLELVLQHLDLKDLFVFQRVCSRWLYIITQSVTLQQQMFLRTFPSSSTIQANVRQGIAKGTTGCWQCDNKKKAAEEVKAILNPLLDLSTGFSPSLANSAFIHHEESPELLNPLPTHFRGKPSWHRMYLTTPPCKEVEIALWWQMCRCGTGSVHSTKVENGEGVRFSDLFGATICMTGTHKAEAEPGTGEQSRKQTSLEGFWKRYEEQSGQVVRMGETTCMFLRGVKVLEQSGGEDERGS